MADLPITLKRYNGTNYDVLYPLTNTEQVEGLIDSNTQKIFEHLLPSSVFGGMRYAGSLSENKTMEECFFLIDGYVSSNGGQPDGCYFVATTTVQLTDPANENITTVLNSGEEGDTDFPIILEPNDWLIVDRYDETEHILYWSVINNTYQDASTTKKGVMRFATSAEAVAGTEQYAAVTPLALEARISEYDSTHTHSATKVRQYSDLSNIGTTSGETLSTILLEIDSKIAGISTNTTNITNNSSNISTNTSNISTNTSNINTMNATLSSHQTTIQGLESRIEILYQDVANSSKVGDIIIEY